jgi:hypothetical protein
MQLVSAASSSRMGSQIPISSSASGLLLQCCCLILKLFLRHSCYVVQAVQFIQQLLLQYMWLVPMLQS